LVSIHARQPTSIRFFAAQDQAIDTRPEQDRAADPGIAAGTSVGAIIGALAIARWRVIALVVAIL
jgi:hypothetical protein